MALPRGPGPPALVLALLLHARHLEMARTAVYGFGLVAALMLGCLHAPVLWSPDGRWVAYTVAVRPSAPELAPGWLYRTAPARRRGMGVDASGASRRGDRLSSLGDPARFGGVDPARGIAGAADLAGLEPRREGAGLRAAGPRG